MPKKILQKKFKVICNSKIKGGYFKIALDAPQITSHAQPGQFVMLQIDSKTYGPLLRRPLSIHAIKKEKLELLYEVVGTGTEILSRKKPGEALDVIGPLGNGFDLTPSSPAYPCPSGRQAAGRHNLIPILVAGGIGVAPLVFLAQKLSGQKPLVFIGAKTKNQILCEKEFKESGCSVKIATDDGSKGFRGLVTDLLRKHLRPNAYNLRPIIYACGPAAMLEATSNLTYNFGISAFGSFEEHLACGIGACMGCAIPTRSEAATGADYVYKRVCKDGPVFALNQIIWRKD